MGRASGETDIIQRYFAPLAAGTPGAFGLNDDAGLVQPPEGHELVVTTDMIVAGIHYLEDTAPRDIAYKAPGVNVSDLCAKGAVPSVYLLSLALSGTPDEKWLKSLSAGLAEAQSDMACTLLGGDTVRTPGPIALSITAIGFVPSRCMVHRAGAQAGEFVYVTGTIGDGVLGLALLRGAQSTAARNLSKEHKAHLRKRYRRPRPRLQAIKIVREYASAAMDISDGLAGDFTKLCAASRVGGTLRAADIPLSAAAALWLAEEPERLGEVITGGDDYEILMTVPEKATNSFEQDCRAAGLKITCIGRISSQRDGVKVAGKDAQPLYLERQSYEHF